MDAGGAATPNVRGRAETPITHHPVASPDMSVPVPKKTSAGRFIHPVTGMLTKAPPPMKREWHPPGMRLIMCVACGYDSNESDPTVSHGCCKRLVNGKVCSSSTYFKHGMQQVPLRGTEDEPSQAPQGGQVKQEPSTSMDTSQWVLPGQPGYAKIVL